MIRALNPSIVVDGDEGRSGSFEVVVDGIYLAHSKVAKRAFPDFRTLAAEIADYAATKKAPASWTRV